MFGFVVHEVLDSTSMEAQRLCSAGEVAPFAVMARMQTAGRGRRGRSWSSMPGNLMMTVVLPPRVWAAGKSIESAPVRAAILLARFVREHFGVRVTLKWPNDLLFAGRKLAGILCESSSSGGTVGDLHIGIGLNLAAAPHLSGPDGVATTCLEEILGLTRATIPDAVATGRELANWLAANWSSLDEVSIPDAFAEYGIDPGQIVVDEPDRTQAATIKGIDSSGAWVLERLDSHEVLQLNSVDQPWRWIYQDTGSGPMPPVLVADVGNSRVKVALWPEAGSLEPVFHQSFAMDEIAQIPWQEIAARWPKAFGKLPLTCHTVSVNGANHGTFAARAAMAGVTVHALPKRPVLLRSKYAWNEIGADRVAAMEGFLARLDSASRGDEDSFAAVVCAGTATTIDVLTFAGRHCGGVILPGVTTALHALHDVAPALPDLSAELARLASANVMASNTREAILGGESAMVAGAVQLLLETAMQNHREKSGPAAPRLRAVFTGGHGNPVMLGFKKLTTLACQLEFVDNLVLDGARSIVLGGRI